MSKGIFLHREDSIYDDRLDEQYQFPKQYLSRATQFIDDWIIYYEPVKGGGKGYFALAKLKTIVPDPAIEGMYLALIEPGSFLTFENAVVFRHAGDLVERGLLNSAGVISGRAQAAVRPVSLADFNRILDFGIPDNSKSLPRTDDAPISNVGNTVFEEKVSFTFEVERSRVQSLTSRSMRDRVFRKVVLDAYDSRCAITGLKLINGGGRAEVQAAHIRPVEHNGPDVLNNGLALSGTAHWMFDRGLIGLSDNLDILVSRHVNDTESVWNLVNPSRRAIVPQKLTSGPHPRFLNWHRDNCFKS